MPKKTREEKIHSQQRKEETLLKMFVSPTLPKEREQPETEQKITITPSVPKEVRSDDSEEHHLHMYFLKDLRKSLFLIAGIIALEIAVYFGTINHYFTF